MGEGGGGGCGGDRFGNGVHLAHVSKSYGPSKEKRDNSSTDMNQFCTSCVPFSLSFSFLCKMLYRCLDLRIEHVRGTFWLYTILSVFSCTKSDQTDVVNIFLSVLLVLGIMFIYQCFVTMIFDCLKSTEFCFSFVLLWFVDEAFLWFCLILLNFESCCSKEDISSFSKVYDFNIIHVMELEVFFLFIFL